MTETRSSRRVPMRLLVDQAIEQLLRDRAALLRGSTADRVRRCEALALTYWTEARYWELLVEHTGMRVLWRAALGARSDARASARYWTEQAERWRRVSVAAAAAVPGPAGMPAHRPERAA